MKRVLITGSGGLIGSEAVEFYIKQNFHVVGIDNNMRQYFFGREGSTTTRVSQLKQFKNYKHYDFCITKIDVDFFLKEGPFDLIIHTAAQPSHDWAVKEPSTDFNINANGTLNLLEHYRKYSPQAVFIFTSTNKVYGDSPNVLEYNELLTRYTPVNQTLALNGFNESLSIDQSTHSLFGVSKTAADLLVQEYGRYFKLSTVIFRGGCLTGPNHSGVELHGFLSYLVKCAKTKTPYKIFGYNGKQVRDNISSTDLISAFDCYYNKPKEPGSVYNIGGGSYSNCSVLEAIDTIESILNTKLTILFEPNARHGDHQWWITDTTKFKKDFPNWKQQDNIQTILTKMCESKTTNIL